MAVEPKSTEIDLEKMIQGIATAVAASTAKAVVDAESKIKVIESQTPDLTSAFNPEGKKNRPKLRRETIFCGMPQREKQLKDREIELFNQIKPGRYNDRKWEVIEHPSPMADTPGTIEVRIQVKEVQDRIELAMTAPNLEAILMKIISEQGK